VRILSGKAHAENTETHHSTAQSSTDGSIIALLGFTYLPQEKSGELGSPLVNWDR